MIALANITFFLILIVGGVFLQIYLSKSENKILGLILPSITFIYSLIMVFSIGVFETVSTSGTFLGLTRETILLTIFTFAMTNIPTIILMTIYYSFRKKINDKIQLEKMNIQDL